MAKMLIRNLGATPLGLPMPFAGVLAGGAGTVLDVGPIPVPALAAFFSPLLGGPTVVEFSEVAEGNPTGPLTNETTSQLLAFAFDGLTNPLSMAVQQLKNLADATDPQDAVTLSYVDAQVGTAMSYSPSAPADWAGAPPTSVAAALDRIAAQLAIIGGGPIP